MTHRYVPEPMDLSNVQIPASLEPLVEQLAENVHNVWAKERIQTGWTYGPQRSDALKQTPLLVPYQDLPESEKIYDRNTALETLRFILASDFEIKKN